MYHALRLVMLAICVTATARAADQTILGAQLSVKNPSTPDRRTVVAKAKEFGSPNTLVGDPTVGGATLTVTLAGGTPGMQTFNLPGGTSPLTGKVFWSGDTLTGFKYRDPIGENGPVKGARVRVKNATFQLKAVASGKLSSITLVPPDPGTSGCVLLAIGGGDSYSLQFADGHIVNKGALQFKVSQPTLEGSCVPST